MRFLFDQNANRRLVPSLRALGHDVTIIGVDYPKGLPDVIVLQIAVAEQRVVLTNDRDFGALVVLQQLPHAGVIYLRLGNMPLIELERRLLAVLEHFGDRIDEFVTVTKDAIRIRDADSL